MKILNYKLFLALIVSFSCWQHNNAYAQADIAAFVQGGIEDANTLLKGYTKPFGESFGVNMNSGWTNTANTLKPGRFEIKLVVNAAFIPQSSRTYNLDAMGLGDPKQRMLYGSQATDQWVYENPVAPTIFGSSDETSTIRKTVTYTDPATGQQTTENITEITLPQGLGVHVNPLPFVPQVSVGLPLKTEIMARFLPSVAVGGDDDDAVQFEGLWGIGLKHDIKQWIPVIKRLPFSLSVVGGFTTMDLGIPLEDMVPVAPGDGSFADPTLAGTAYDGPVFDESNYVGQAVSLTSSAWNVSVLASKKLSVFTAFGGLRYSKSVTKTKLNGIYGFAGDIYINEDDQSDPNNYRYVLVNTDKDPINIASPIGQLGLVGGFRLKFGFFNLFAEGTLSKYSSVSAGLGFGWMN